MFEKFVNKFAGLGVTSKKTLMLVSALLICVMVFAAFVPVFASERVENQLVLKEVDRNNYYVSVFQNLADSFPVSVIDDEYGRREAFSYPDEYAGAYIDEFNNLHIVLTASVHAKTEYDYKKILGDGDVIFDTAEFPLTLLYQIQYCLTSIMEKFTIDFIVLNEVENRLDVHMIDRTKESAVLEFLKVNFDNFNERCIAFNDSAGIEISASNTVNNALAGSRTSVANGGAVTLGFNAYRAADGKYGVVTAAHFATSGTVIRNALGTPIGSASARQLGGNVDCAFVPFPSTITRSTKLLTSNYNDDIKGICSNSQIIVGMDTSKFGAVSGENLGKVVSVSATGFHQALGINFTDQVVVTNSQQAGDSGGPVLREFVGPLTPRVLVGIACFKDTSNNNAVVSKAGNIVTALSITPYTA